MSHYFRLNSTARDFWLGGINESEFANFVAAFEEVRFLQGRNDESNHKFDIIEMKNGEEINRTVIKPIKRN
jgi:hypothetical protein